MEKLIAIPWDYIELKCGREHTNQDGKIYNPPMEIKMGTASAYYDCPDPHCPNRIPPLVYEKLMDMVCDVINEGKANKGYKWDAKISRQKYSFEVLNKTEKKITIGIINVSSLQRGSQVLRA